jgi:hypothetical protein
MTGLLLTRRRPNLVALSLTMLFMLAIGRADAQPLAPADVEARIVGTYELIEWRVDGQVLKPPVANGRLVFHDGQIIAMFRREENASAYDFAGHGTYLVDGKMWSYGFDYRLEVTGTAGRNTVVHTTRELIPFTYRLDGANLVLDYRNGERRFVFGPDELTYIEMGQVLRRWNRIKTGL